MLRPSVEIIPRFTESRNNRGCVLVNLDRTRRALLAAFERVQDHSVVDQDLPARLSEAHFASEMRQGFRGLAAGKYDHANHLQERRNDQAGGREPRNKTVRLRPGAPASSSPCAKTCGTLNGAGFVAGADGIGSP